MKIAFFHFGFFYEGGGERLVLEQMKGLEQKGHKAVCFTPIYIKDKCYPDWIDKFKIKVLVPQWLNWFSDGLVIEMLTASWLIIFQFWRFFKFDVFVGIGQPGAWMAFCAAKILRKSYLVWMNQPTRFLYPRQIDIKNGLRISDKRKIGTRLIRALRPLISLLDNISVCQADILMCNSKLIAGWLKRVYKKEVVQNYPGGGLSFPTAGFDKRNYEQRFKGVLRIKNKVIEKPFLLVTNRHFPQKKFEYAISIMPFLIEEIPGLNLVITGRENRHTKQLKVLAYQLGLEKKVIFTGSVKEKDLKRLYCQAVVYLYPSPQEDYGMGVVEAMSAGTPVVAWNEAGPKETIVNGKTGYLVEPYNLKEMADKTKKIIKSLDLMKKLGNNGRKRARKFSYSQHVDKLEKHLPLI